MVKALQGWGIPCLELLRSTSPTRAVAGSLSHIHASLSDPGSSSKLAKAYRVWRRDWRGDRDREILIRRVASELTRLRRLEDFFTWGAFGIPSDPGVAASGIQAPLADADSSEGQLALRAELAAFHTTASRWHQATVLPVDQLILALSPDVFTSSADLALAHKLALVMGQLASEIFSGVSRSSRPISNQITRNKHREPSILQ